MLDFAKLKRDINLVEYAGAQGYVLDRRKSTARSVVMMLEDQDKIIITRRDDIWMYFSVYDDLDHGTIFDFIRNRSDQSLYEIGQDLEAYQGQGRGEEFKIRGDAYLNKPIFDPARIKRLFSYCVQAKDHEYLSGRGINAMVLNSDRFRGRILQDHFRNAVFAHFKDGEACALELKNHDLNLFVRGSEKTLWRSNWMRDDDQLLIAESPIDALSYHMIFDLKHGFYIATGGGFSTAQKQIIQDFISASSWIKSITLITDNDQGGDKLASRLEDAINETSFNGTTTRHSPPIKGRDWNDVLNNYCYDN